jgi:hypothetical protein
VKCNVLPDPQGGGFIDGLSELQKDGAGCRRSLVSKVGNLKRADISIAKFSKEMPEVGGVHSTYDFSVNKSLNRKLALIVYFLLVPL